jgi:hypothetical protein
LGAILESAAGNVALSRFENVVLLYHRSMVRASLGAEKFIPITLLFIMAAPMKLARSGCLLDYQPFWATLQVEPE